MGAIDDAFGFRRDTAGSSGLTSITLQNSVFVAKNGDDATGLRNRLDKPFLTCGAAKAAALAGDTVYVFAGVYDEKNLLKDLVNWQFFVGAQVRYTGADDGAIWDDSAATGAGTGVTSVIEGFGIFDNDGTGSANHCVLVEDASVLTFIADIFTANASASTIKMDSATGLVTIQIGAIDHTLGSELSIEVISSSSFNALNTTIAGDNDGEIILAGGTGNMELRDCKITNDNAGASTTCILKSDDGDLALKNVTLRNLGAGTTTVTSAPADAEDVLVYSAVANKGVGVDITQKVNSIIVDPAVTV
jgi:hypothetical protein